MTLRCPAPAMATFVSQSTLSTNTDWAGTRHRHDTQRGRAGNIIQWLATVLLVGVCNNSCRLVIPSTL
jgi:hypothetical protein